MPTVSAARLNSIAAPAAWLESAERELNAHHPQAAADAAASGLSGAQSRQLKQHLLAIRVQALAELGDTEAAFDANRQILTLATSRTTLGDDLFALAQTNRDLGKRDAAVQALKTEVEEFPTASTTHQALRLLDDLGATGTLDPFVLGRARYMAGDLRNAVSALDTSLRTDPDGPDAQAARLYRALARLTPGNETAALADLDALAADPAMDPDLTAQALLNGGQALEGLALPDQAEAHYARLADAHPGADQAATASFRLGLLRYGRGDDAGALAAWDHLLARRDNLSPDDVARALSWRGKALARQGRDDAARAAWTEAAGVRPAGLYALTAASRIGALPSGSPETVITTDDEQSLAHWLAARNQDLAAAAAAVTSDPALQRADAMARLGLAREAGWEADELTQRYADRTDRLYVLARRFNELGLAGAGARLGQAALAAAGAQTLEDAPIALRKLAYPRPFFDLVSGAEARYGLDPLLLDAWFAQASGFDVWAEQTSTGARGLAQITPVHADEIGHALQGPTARPGDVAADIEGAAWLLADRLRRFDGRPEAALAAIASADRVADGWMMRPGADDPEVLLESIDADPVRDSVRQVLTARAAYRLTYASSRGGPAGDPFAAVSIAPEPTPAWIKIARLSSDGDAGRDVPLSPPLNDASAPATDAQRDGEYATAARAFTALTGSPDPEIAAGAQLRLGQALLADRRPAEALEPLQAAERAAGNNAPSPATYLIGRAQARLGRCDHAVAAFEQFAASAPAVLAAHARAAESACLIALNRTAEAVAAAQAAADTPDLPRLQALTFRERLALTRARAGDETGSRHVYEGLLAEARSSSYKAELNADIGLLTGDPDRLRAAVHLDPHGHAAQAALDELIARNDPSGRSLDAATTRVEQNRYREALTAYRSVAASSTDPSDVAQALYGSGVCLVRLGLDRAGTTQLESISARYPELPQAADGLFRGGRIRESLGDLAGADHDYGALLGLASSESRADDARFRQTFVRFRQGRLADAVAGWSDLTTAATTAPARVQAYFWLGKGLSARGDDAGARDAWTRARDGDPHGYYGLRAADLLDGHPDPRNAAGPAARALTDDPHTSAAAWADSNGDRALAEERLAGDPGITRAMVLLGMGQRESARWELQATQARLGDQPSAVALLGAWEEQHGLYNAALALGYDLAALRKESVASAPAAVRRLAFPLPHPRALADAAGRARVDPLLLAGLMRQESALDSTAVSASQARGLTQMVASTAYAAARASGQYAFTSADLFTPRISIVLGAYTLGEGLRRYDQQIFPALAAYNASQFAVDGWLQAASGDDIDTFAESIPFTETYPYVQRIYENMRAYGELYVGP